MKKLLLLLWIIPYLAFSQGGGKTIAFQKNMMIFNGQQSSYFLDTTSTAQAKAGQLTLNYTENTNSVYTSLLDSKWNSGADINAGGGWGLHGRGYINHTVQNVIGTRGVLYFDGLGANEALNQARGIEGAINLDDTYTLTVTDDLSAIGGYIGPYNAADITTGDEGILNIANFVYLPETDMTAVTNGVNVFAKSTSQGVRLDYGFHLVNQGIMNSGIWIEHQDKDHTSVTNDIKMTSVSGDVVNGINMSGAVYSGSDWILQNSATINNSDANTLSVEVNSVEAARFVENTTTQLLVGNGTSALPSYSFINDPNGGFYSDGTNIFAAINGSRVFSINTAHIDGINSTRFRISLAGPTSTAPIFIPKGSDTDSGIGAAGLDSLSLIAGGVEGIRIAEGGGKIKVTVTDTLEIGGDSRIQQTTTTTANSYHNHMVSEWTAGADMAAGGSNGIYSISNPVEDVNNAYALRGRMDLRDAGAAVDVNQLHAIDALINFNTSHVYDVVDNLSVIGAAVHGNGADITGDGVLDEESLNLFYGVWGPTATQDFEITTNGLLLISHASTYLDYGVTVENSGAMTAGLYLNNHASNSPATMTSGILMESAAGNMTYGINMSGAGITTAEFVGQNSATIDNVETDTITITETVTKIEGNLVVTGNLEVAGTESKFADMYLNANGTATTMETADTPIGVRYFTTGDQNGFTFDAGGTGAITAYADFGVAAGDTVTVTDNGHGLADGDFIVIRGTTNYNGVWEIGYIGVNSFYIVDTWVADDGASDWEEPSYLQLTAGVNEVFDIAWYLSCQKAGGASATVQWCAYKNTTPLNKTIAQRELPGTDIGSVSGGGLVPSVSAGDRFFMIIQSDNTNDITNRYGALILIQE